MNARHGCPDRQSHGAAHPVSDLDAPQPPHEPKPHAPPGHKACCRVQQQAQRRNRCSSLTTQLTLTANCRAAALRETPPSTAATIRLRRSRGIRSSHSRGLRPSPAGMIWRAGGNPAVTFHPATRRRHAANGGGLGGRICSP